jgi:hypothetical protein
MKNPRLGLEKIRYGFRWVCSHAEDEMDAIFEAVALRRLPCLDGFQLKHYLKSFL